MMDGQGRVWITSTVRPPANPDFCKEGSSHPSAKVFPLANAGRHLAVYDPKTKQLTHISTCFSTHHLMFAEDANNTLWTSAGGGGGAIGWLNTKMFDETKDEVKSQGWSPFILDTNGNGKRDAYVEPDQPVDPTKDKRIQIGLYAASPAPDGSVWGTVLGFPGAVVRVVPGPDPTDTAVTEYYEAPGTTRRRRCTAFLHAAATSIATASSGRPSRAATWPASIGANARSVERPDGHRCPLSRGLDALSGAAAAAAGCDDAGQCRSQLLHLGRSVRHARAGRATCRSIPATALKACSR